MTRARALALLLAPALALASLGQAGAQAYARNSAFSLRPLEMLKDLEGGGFGLAYEAGTAFQAYGGAKTLGRLSVSQDRIWYRLNIGLQGNPLGQALEGLSLGLYPGIALSLREGVTSYRPSLLVEAGLGWHLGRGILVGAYAMTDLLEARQVSLGARIGYCFENSRYKVVKQAWW